MDDLAGAHEGGAAGGIIAQTRTLQSLFVLLVALLTRLLVVLDQVHVPQGNLVQVIGVDLFCQVGVEVLVLHGPLALHANNRRAVRQLLDLSIFWGHLILNAFVLIDLFVL